MTVQLPAATSCSSERSNEVKAKATAARKELTATKYSERRDFIYCQTEIIIRKQSYLLLNDHKWLNVFAINVFTYENVWSKFKTKIFVHVLFPVSWNSQFLT